MFAHDSLHACRTVEFELRDENRIATAHPPDLDRSPPPSRMNPCKFRGCLSRAKHPLLPATDPHQR
jgi:hypothetical protein